MKFLDSGKMSKDEIFEEYVIWLHHYDKSLYKYEIIKLMKMNVGNT